MNVELSSAWLMLLALGVFHGINPGMGWLFAVGLGLQEQQRAAVWRSLLPLALGHALAIAAAVAVATLFASMLPLTYVRWGVAAVLVAFGTYRLFRRGHPRYGGMQVGRRELTVWSFLMASAHGAGLMVLPFVFGTSAVEHASHVADGAQHAAHIGEHAAHVAEHAAHGATHAVHGATLADGYGVASALAGGHDTHVAAVLASLPAEPVIGFLTALVHTAGYLIAMGLIAVIVYEKVGLRLLRSTWINIDVIWAATLIATGVLTAVL